MALFKVTAQRAQFDLSDNNSTDVYGAGIRFDQNGFARANTSAGTFFNQGIPMSASGQVSIVDATAGLPSGTIFHNGLPISGEKVCVSRNATSVVSSGLPFDSNGALAADLNFDLNFVNATTLDSNITFTRASSATYFDSAGVLQTATTNTPRFDYNPATLASRGLLIEEQRTNSIRNNTMQGAVAGTPGTEPTNWASSGSGSGVTRQIVGVGTENGIAYADVRFYGTPTAGTSVSIGFEPTNQIAATAGQTWTESVFVKLQAGSFTNTSTTVSLLATNGVSGTEAFNSTAITSTPADLRNCRLTMSGTLAAALGTTHVQPRVRIGYTVGVAFDITLRIGLPQLELGAFATSVIPTTTTALTRNADLASVNTLSPWFNAAEGTLFAEGTVVNNIVGTTARAYAEFGNAGSGSERFAIEARSTTSTRARVTIGGVSVSSSVTYNALGTNTKVAGAYGADGVTACVAGLSPVTTATSLFGPVTSLFLGTAYTQSGASNVNGYLRRVTYYPRRLSNAELQAITS